MRHAEAEEVPGPSGVVSVVKRRMSGPERRRQLLEVAEKIVREEGTDSLTLARLATAAGVSKPVVYDHFGTRAGVLVTLYRELDEQQMRVFRTGLAQRPTSLPKACHALAAAYVTCATATSGEFSAVGSALEGTPEHAAVTGQLLDGYVALFDEVLSAHTTSTDGVGKEELRRRSIGLVGAAEALSAAVRRGEMSSDAAITTLSALMEAAPRHERLPLHRPSVEAGHDRA